MKGPSNLEKFVQAATCELPMPSAQPWNQPTINSEYIHARGSLLAANSATAQLVVSYKVPNGFKAIISHVAMFYTGGPSLPVEGDSASLSYFIRINSTIRARDFSSVVTTLGSVTRPYEIPGGIRLSGGELIEGFVSIPLASPISVGAGNYVHIFLIGYRWPESQ